MNDAKARMMQAVLTCLHQGQATNTTDLEIDRCMQGRAAEGALCKYAKEFRDSGELNYSPESHPE